jgi:hypothetical protein
MIILSFPLSVRTRAIVVPPYIAADVDKDSHNSCANTPLAVRQPTIEAGQISAEFSGLTRIQHPPFDGFDVWKKG